MESAHSQWLGSIGVAILLSAFFLNLRGRLSHESRLYSLMNLVGAGMAAYASYLIRFIPFVVLEGTWFIVALVALCSGFRAGRLSGEA